MKIAIICLSLFLLNACANDRYIIKNCCAEVIIDEKSLKSKETTPDQIDKERDLWKAAYYSCFCK